MASFVPCSAITAAAMPRRTDRAYCLDASLPPLPAGASMLCYVSVDDEKGKNPSQNVIQGPYCEIRDSYE